MNCIAGVTSELQLANGRTYYNQQCNVYCYWLVIECDVCNTLGIQFCTNCECN